MLGFSYTSNITTDNNSIIVSNGSLVFGINGNSRKLITFNENRFTNSISDLIIS